MNSKKIILLFFLISCSIHAIAQTYYYYYNGNKIPLILNENKVCVSVPKEYDKTCERIRENAQVWATMSDENFDTFIITRSEYEKLVSQVFWEEDSKSVILTSSYYTVDNKEVFETPYLNVKLKNEDDKDLLASYAEKYKLRIMGDGPFSPLMPLWYSLYVTLDSKKSPLDCANELQESGDFVYSILDLASDNQITIQTTIEYYPEGTKWTEVRLDTLKYDSWYSKVGNEWVPNFETIEYYVKGEFVDKFAGDGTDKYKCVYTNGPEWTDSLTLLLQEEGDAEYVGHNSVMVSVLTHDSPDIIRACFPATAYQFDWSIGKGLYYEDILMSNTTGYPWHVSIYYGIIDEIKEGYFGGVKPLKYVELNGKAPVGQGNCDSEGGRILQGIGIIEWNDGECLFGPPNPYSALSMLDSNQGEKYPQRHYRSMIVHFERNGEVLYDAWPQKETTDDIKSIRKVETSCANTLYDLQGRSLSAKPQRGIYIQNGRKYIVK